MRTPLTAWHERHGATLVDDRGVTLPERFTNARDEYQAVRERAGLIDLSFRVPVCMTGADRVTFFQGMVSNDVKALKPGEGCAATLLTEQGRVVADLRVYALGDAFLLDVDVRAKEKLVEALSRFIIADDVELEDLSGQQVMISLQGPLSSRVLQAAGVSAAADGSFRHAGATVGDVPVRVLHVSDTGEDGYAVIAPQAEAAQVWQALLDAGSPLGVRPVGLGALNALRIEAGIPWYGLDMDEGRLVLEVGLEQAISFTKGCYLGQEVVERATARGHVNRRLSGLLVQGDTMPAHGDKLFRDAQEVGWVTSAADSPHFGRPIALGYIRREYLTPGTKLRIDRGGTPVIAEVSPLPFITRQRAAESHG